LQPKYHRVLRIKADVKGMARERWRCVIAAVAKNGAVAAAGGRGGGGVEVMSRRNVAKWLNSGVI